MFILLQDGNFNFTDLIYIARREVSDAIHTE